MDSNHQHHNTIAVAICALTCELREWRMSSLATKADLREMEERLLDELGGSDEQVRRLRAHAQTISGIASPPDTATTDLGTRVTALIAEINRTASDGLTRRSPARSSRRP